MAYRTYINVKDDFVEGIQAYLKKKGIKSRGRIYEIPKTIAYAIVPPRMSTYIQYSEKVIL